jgi:hypothetical protein
MCHAGTFVLRTIFVSTFEGESDRRAKLPVSRLNRINALHTLGEATVSPF